MTRFLSISLVTLVASIVVYAAAFFISGMGEADPSPVESVLLWIGIIGFAGSLLALIGGLIAHAVRGTDRRQEQLRKVS
jgi:membrane associated rhomboid family serine protease